MARVFNFSAGPAALPEAVLAQAAEEMLDWHGSGQSVMEMSHRGKEFMSIAAQAEADLRELMAIPANYKVLFLQGGASLQFAMIPLNLLRGKPARTTSTPANGRRRRSRKRSCFCTPNVAASSEDKNFTYVPDFATWKLSKDAAYVHITSNETIGGLEYHQVPDTGDVPLVADMSSHILSRPVDVSKYGLIYAGAQKNIGPAGLAIVIVREDLIGGVAPKTPVMLDYKTHADNDSMYNTPPTYGIYIAGLVFQWLKKQGGLAAMERAQPGEGASSCTTASMKASSSPTRCAIAGPFAHERPLHPEERGAGRSFPQGRQGARDGATEGPPLRGRHARVHLQRDAHRRRQATRRVHERFREEPWLIPIAS